MVLLIGNYSADQQQSMQRFNAMMLQGLEAAGIHAILIRPQPFLGRFRAAGRFISKWLGYIDKYVFFPFHLRRTLAARPQIVHVCDHSNAVYVKRCGDFPVLVTCHDLLAVRGGLGEQTDSPASITGRILQRWILLGLHRANALACISKATARDAERLVDRTNGRPQIDVVYLGLNYPYRKLDPEVARARLAQIRGIDLDLPFVLHVGSNARRKNREGVLRIFSRCRKEWDGQLVFAGDTLTPQLYALATELGVSKNVVRVDNPSNDVLETLYNCALAFLYPSRFEGFGWPVIEAQACGCPVVCSNVGPLPEAAGAAGLLHDVDDEAGFAADLLRLANETDREEWSEKSLGNAQKFSADQMIARYIDIYRQLGARV